MIRQQVSFSGIWYCAYWYPSNHHDGEDVSEYYVQIHRKGNGFVLHSLPNEEKSYMLARFTIDNDLVTGTWQENTSPTGSFGGSIYCGAFQLLLDESGTSMTGKWVGIGQDHGTRKIYSNRWEVHRVEDKKIIAELERQHALA